MSVFILISFAFCSSFESKDSPYYFSSSSQLILIFGSPFSSKSSWSDFHHYFESEFNWKRRFHSTWRGSWLISFFSNEFFFIQFRYSSKEFKSLDYLILLFLMSSSSSYKNFIFHYVFDLSIPDTVASASRFHLLCSHSLMISFKSSGESFHKEPPMLCIKVKRISRSWSLKLLSKCLIKPKISRYEIDPNRYRWMNTLILFFNHYRDSESSSILKWDSLMIDESVSIKGARNWCPLSRWTEEMKRQLTLRMTEFYIVALTHMSVKMSE